MTEDITQSEPNDANDSAIDDQEAAESSVPAELDSATDDLENSEPDDPATALQTRIDEFNGNLRWKEDMVLSCLTEEIHSAYRKSWITDANMFFRRAAVLKKRRN